MSENHEALDAVTEVHQDPMATTGIDITKFSVDQRALTLGSLKPETATIPVGRPGRQEWIWIYGNPQYQLVAPVFRYEEGTIREHYLVAKEVADAFDPQVCRPTLLVLYQTRQKQMKIWPVMLPSGGAGNQWVESAITIVESMADQWISVRSNMAAGAYDLVQLNIPKDPPSPPELSISEILGVAFSGKVIDSPDHMMVQKYHGLA